MTQCEHEKLGRVLAHSYATAREAINTLALTKSYRLDGLTASEWDDVANSYAGQMLTNNAQHERTCES